MGLLLSAMTLSEDHEVLCPHMPAMGRMREQVTAETPRRGGVPNLLAHQILIISLV